MRGSLTSSVGKKLVNGISGLALMAFIIVHLGGNLTLFAGKDWFNSYAYHLESLVPLVVLAEIGLIAVILLHVVSALSVQLDKLRARPEAYAVVDTKGGPSHKTLASRSMLYTGIVLAIFIPLHVWMFKFNAGQNFSEAELHGRMVKDLHAVVDAAFQKPSIVAAYMAVMFLLGFHLRHGFWSALQSLGAMKPQWSGAIYTLGLAFALLVAGGFFILPLWMYLLHAGGAP